MRNNIIITTLLVLLCAGCQKLEDYNINPNEPKAVPSSYLLNGALASFALSYCGNVNSILYCQYWAENYGTNTSRYEYTNAPWDYATLLNLNEVIRLCTEDPAAAAGGGDPDNQIAVARIVRAFQFQTMTDGAGDIPYSQALGENLTPEYDPQESIYRGLLRELEEAAAQIKPNAAGPVADLVYSGDMIRWRSFANALALRVAIRMADRDWPVAKAAIEKAYNNGALAGNGDNAMFAFEGGSDYYRNPVSWNFDADFGYISYSVSHTLVNLLKTLEDPRLPRYAEPAVNSGLFEGKRYGLPDDENAAEDPSDFSAPAATIIQPASPGMLMVYAEQCFILAEAIERGAALPGTAAGWYQQGIRASMEQWGVDSAATDAYLARPDVDYTTAAGNWKQKIGAQKWLALYPQGNQAWSEWRRLDFGILAPPPGLNFIITRYLYPDQEQTTNLQSYQEAVSRLPGGDKVTSKVWWDVN